MGSAHRPSRSQFMVERFFSSGEHSLEDLPSAATIGTGIEWDRNLDEHRPSTRPAGGREHVQHPEPACLGRTCCGFIQKCLKDTNISSCCSTPTYPSAAGPHLHPALPDTGLSITGPYNMWLRLGTLEMRWSRVERAAEANLFGKEMV